MPIHPPGFYSRHRCIPCRCPCWHSGATSSLSGTEPRARSLALLSQNCTCREKTRGVSGQRHCLLCPAQSSTQVPLVTKVLLQLASRQAQINIKHFEYFGSAVVWSGIQQMQEQRNRCRNREEQTYTLWSSPTSGHLLSWNCRQTQRVDLIYPVSEDTSLRGKAAEMGVPADSKLQQ